jgi:hypothetical protein
VAEGLLLELELWAKAVVAATILSASRRAIRRKEYMYFRFPPREYGSKPA